MEAFVETVAGRLELPRDENEVQRLGHVHRTGEVELHTVLGGELRAVGGECGHRGVVGGESGRAPLAQHRVGRPHRGKKVPQPSRDDLGADLRWRRERPQRRQRYPPRTGTGDHAGVLRSGGVIHPVPTPHELLDQRQRRVHMPVPGEGHEQQVLWYAVDHNGRRSSRVRSRSSSTTPPMFTQRSRSESRPRVLQSPGSATPTHRSRCPTLPRWSVTDLAMSSTRSCARRTTPRPTRTWSPPKWASSSPRCWAVGRSRPSTKCGSPSRCPLHILGPIKNTSDRNAESPGSTWLTIRRWESAQKSCPGPSLIYLHALDVVFTSGEGRRADVIVTDTGSYRDAAPRRSQDVFAQTLTRSGALSESSMAWHLWRSRQ